MKIIGLLTVIMFIGGVSPTLGMEHLNALLRAAENERAFWARLPPFPNGRRVAAYENAQAKITQLQAQIAQLEVQEARETRDNTDDAGTQAIAGFRAF